MSLAEQLIRMQSLFAKGMSRSSMRWRERTIMPFFHIQAFPRLVLRKSPSQTLAPVAELGQLLSHAAKYATVAEGRSLVRGAALMVQELGTWAKEKAGDDLPGLATSHVSGPTLSHHSCIQARLCPKFVSWQALLESFLNAAVEACADLVASCIAQRVFEACFPRLSYRSVIRQDWKDGQDALLLALVRFLYYKQLKPRPQ
jgi:hypothetical protein